MTRPSILRPIAGVLLCVLGFAVAWPPGTHFRKTTVIVDAGGCRLVTDVIDRGEDETQGSVLLFHGLAANKKIMSYIAQGFALQNLRVFVPDLPGHGRTPGPFSFARSAACADAFAHQLLARGAIDDAHTIMVGHSMGGAIAVIAGGRMPVAGVVAISPAPMTPARGIPSFMLPFENPPPTPANTLAISGTLEPGGIRATARDLADSAPAGSGKFIQIPRSTHVSVLFDARVVRAAQEWSGRLLHLSEASGAVPSFRPVAGWFAGFVGLLVLTGPFIRETVGPLLFPTPRSTEPTSNEDIGPDGAATYDFARTDIAIGTPILTTSAQVAAFSILAVIILKFWEPMRFVHIFHGDYLSSLLLLLGIALLAWHRKEIAAALRGRPIALLSAALAALMLHFLVMGWFEITMMETWLIAARWLRFPAVLLAVLPFHLAEEILLGSVAARSPFRRLATALWFRLLTWGAAIGGIFLLHSGEILLVLLAVYIGAFCVLQRLGMQVVRKSTGSPLATALFGAILLSGFALVVFPIN
jgi:pimeloyl-ACP methyl ester carboxylesterase